MNPETDAELIERVINDENTGTSFDLASEELAYARHLSERGLTDTEANRATWFAARDYYDQPTEGDTEGPDDSTISYSDLALRQQALSYASSNTNGENVSSTVARAKAYLKFLQNGGEE